MSIESMPEFHPDDALLVVDVQQDFCPGGALAVPEGDQIVSVLNEYIDAAVRGRATIVASRDWHPPNHVSFAARGGPWPEHCVQGTAGAELHPDLRLPEGALLLSKGRDPDRDEYSAFDGTALAATLKELGVRRVFIGGLAQDVCVRASVLDALRAGFETHLIASATRPVDATEGLRTLGEVQSHGAIVDGAAPASTS